MPTFTPPVTDGRLVGDPSQPSWRFFRHFGSWATGQTVWKDAQGVWHRSITPYLGGAVHTVHDWDGSTVTAPDAGLATAQEVYEGGHAHPVTEAKRADLVAAGFFVGGHWDSEENKWITYATNSENDKAFKAGDATCSVNIAGSSSFWSHADTTTGSINAAGSVVATGLQKNSVVLRSLAGTLDAQLYSEAGPSPAWKHPNYPSGGFTPMDMVLDGVGTGLANVVVIGWAEPTTFGLTNGEGLLLTLNAFGGASVFTEYSLANGKFFGTAVYNDTSFHYIVGRESDFSLVVPNNNGVHVFNNDAQRNWTRLARTSLGSLTNSATWQFWNGTAWVSDQSAAVNSPGSRLTDTRGAEIEGITDLTKVGSEFVLAAMSQPGSPTIRLYKSTNVEGPYRLYHTTADPDRVPNGGGHPPDGLRYWSGFPKFHEYLNPDSLTLIASHSHGVYAPNLDVTHGPSHVSQGIPNFVYLPTPGAV